jgi:hypothetical protein
MSDITTQILIEIRDEIRQTNSRLDQTNSRLDQTNSRLERLERRQVDTEVRLGTELATLTGVMRELRDFLRDDLSLRAVVTDHEHRLATLEGAR